MVWWDTNAERYRSTLVHKIFYVWGWAFIRYVLFLLPSETAQHLAIKGIRLVEWIERIWGAIVLGVVILALLLIWAMTLLPWFTCEPTND